MTWSRRIALVLSCGTFVAACAEGVAPPSEDIAGGNDGARLATVTSGYTHTRYPIVLAHGMGGWQELFGVVDYFYGIPADLRAGGASVYVTSVSAFASSEARGEQLLSQIEYIAAASGAGKVNLIGHSQGGLDARYVLAARPDLIASLTTVATPHTGSQLADWLDAHVSGGTFTGVVFETLGNAIGLALDLLAGTDHPQDAIAAVHQVTTQVAADFNARYPVGLPATSCGSGPDTWHGVRFYSWSGASALTNILDLTDAPLGVTWLFNSGSSDGLVDRCGSHFGRVLRDNYSMNHLDEVNQILGLVSLFETSPKAVFREHANRLKNAGL
jgi:triacylglycerol lipase